MLNAVELNVLQKDLRILTCIIYSAFIDFKYQICFSTMTLKSVIIDLDGTLLNDDRKVGERDLKTLYELGKKGVVRIIATGRSLFSFYDVIPEDFPIDYLIIAAGGGTVDFKTKKITQSYFIRRNEVQNIVLKLDDLKVDYQVRAKIPDSHKYFYRQFSDKNPDFIRLNTIYKEHVKKLNGIDELEDAARIIIIAQNTDIVKIIEDEFAEYSIIRATSPIDHKSVWMEIYPEGVNKGSAVKNLCIDLNINLTDTIGIGNDYNDIHFLDIVGKSYIVSNAPGDLIQKYQTIISNNRNPLSYVMNGTEF